MVVGTQGQSRPKKTGHNMKYTYHINLNERGCFYADVRDADGKTVFEVKGGDELPEGESSLVEDGFMRHLTDVDGLAEYMRSLGYSVESLSLAA